MFEVFLGCRFSSVLSFKRFIHRLVTLTDAMQIAVVVFDLTCSWSVTGMCSSQFLCKSELLKSLAATIADADVAIQTKHSFLLQSSVCILCLKVKGTQQVRLTHADVDYRTLYFQ